MKLRDAVYKCDFCERESNGEQEWVFRWQGDTGSIHNERRHFGLCFECSGKLLNKEALAKKLMRWFGISQTQKGEKP